MTLIEAGIQKKKENHTPVALPEYKSILVAIDASEHSNRGVLEAVSIGRLAQSTITGAHVYAAKMHDRRFRQMEGGLPANFREENELERQRGVHDELITKGLSVITDSYLDEAECVCTTAGLKYVRCSLEGKNYREMVNEANNNNYDLLVLGALGLGSTTGSRIGTVCERVIRRANIDTLVIKKPDKALNEGPVVVAIDGSEKSFGGLLTALSLVKKWQVPLHVVSAYDPYYHYVAFNRIATVLSDEAGKIFRFKEQEQLHEDIIDAGLAKIYQGHLQVAESIATEQNVMITTKLLDGKPYEAVEKYVNNVNPSLLVIGKLGVHADDALDIGGNAENLLRNLDCALLLSQRQHKPQIELLAEASISWTLQAEQRMKDIPSFAQGIARTAILRFAHKRGHTVITQSIVLEATESLCPARRRSSTASYEKITQSRGKQEIEALNPTWSAEAEELLHQITDTSLQENIRRRAEKYTRQQKGAEVTVAEVQKFMSEKRADSCCPFKFTGQEKQLLPKAEPLIWSEAAQLMLQRVPVGTVRTMVKRAIDTIAQQSGLTHIDEDFFQRIVTTFQMGAKGRAFEMPWSEAAKQGIAKAPSMVQGMLIKEIENLARSKKANRVDECTVKQAKKAWEDTSYFHLEPGDSRGAVK